MQVIFDGRKEMEVKVFEDKKVLAEKVSEMLSLDVFIYVGEDNDIWY